MACVALALFLLLASAGSGFASGAKKEGPAFVNLPAIVLPVFEGNSVSRQAGLVLTLALAEGKSEADVEPQQRRLIDAFIGDLTGIYEQRQGADRVIDAPLVKTRLLATAERILGPGVVSEILIQQAFERRRR